MADKSRTPIRAAVWMCVFVCSMLANLLAWLNQANWVGTKQAKQAKQASALLAWSYFVRNRR